MEDEGRVGNVKVFYDVIDSPVTSISDNGQVRSDQHCQTSHERCAESVAIVSFISYYSYYFLGRTGII